MITFDSVSLMYARASECAVTELSFQARRGELLAVVGPNGSGKSTIVRSLLGVVPMVGGRILLDETSITDLQRRDIARLISIVPQREEPVFPLPVREFVELGRLPFLSPWRSPGPEDALAVEMAIQRAGISALAARHTDELSGGEWQRVRVARALAQCGEALILDEPSAFLDIAHEMAVFELAHELAAEGKAVMLVSHQINLVARFADRMILLNRGAIAASGPPSEVMRGDLLEEIYQWPLVVTRDPVVGAPALLPLRSRR